MIGVSGSLISIKQKQKKADKNKTAREGNKKEKRKQLSDWRQQSDDTYGPVVRWVAGQIWVLLFRHLEKNT